jgi:hypothetical protein
MAIKNGLRDGGSIARMIPVSKQIVANNSNMMFK